MKKPYFILSLAAIFICIVLSACFKGQVQSGQSSGNGLNYGSNITSGSGDSSKDSDNSSSANDVEPTPDNEESIMYISVNGKKLICNLYDNASVTALLERLKNGDITLTMDDYGNMEKVGDLDFSLVRSDTPTSTGPGDVILYLGKSIAIYYDTNNWNFTPIGHIEGVSTREQMLDIFGGYGRVTVVLSLS